MSLRKLKNQRGFARLPWPSQQDHGRVLQRFKQSPVSEVVLELNVGFFVELQFQVSLKYYSKITNGLVE